MSSTGERIDSMEAEPPRSQLVRTATVSISIVILAWFVDNIDRALVAFALPSIGDEFSASNTQLGWVVSGFTLSVALMKIPAGLLVDRFGPRRLLTFELVAWAAFMFLIGLTSTLWALIGLRLVFGFAAGLMGVSTYKLVGERIIPRWRTVGSSSIMTANLIAISLVPLVVAPLMTSHSWRSLFMWASVIGLVGAAYVWFFLPAPLPLRLREEVRADNDDDLTARQILRLPAVWRFGLLAALMNLITFGLFFWGPTYLIRERGVDAASTGWMTSVAFGAMGVAVVCGSLLFDRVFSERPRLLATPALLLSSILMVPMIFADTAGGFVVFQTLALVSSGLADVTVIGTIMRRVPTRAIGAVMGVQGMGSFLGGFVSPLLIGFISDQISFTAAFSVLIFTTALAALVFLAVKPDFLARGLEKAAVEEKAVHQGQS
ncbi:MFS transporter [Streptomyces sp. NPDC004610]|uniref:MFS transporter n=1 Tax=unclassified Streptomyces TaxID=2593676 RepID=UPI0033A6F16B